MIFFECLTKYSKYLEDQIKSAPNADIRKERRERLKTYKQQIKLQAAELKLKNKLKSNYLTKIKSKNNGKDNWVIFYDEVLFSNGIINEDWFEEYRGTVMRQFCKLYVSELRPWKDIENPIIQKFDQVTHV